MSKGAQNDETGFVPIFEILDEQKKESLENEGDQVEPKQDKETEDRETEESPAPSTVKRRKKKAYPVSVNLANCKYDVVRDVIRSLNWIEVGDDDEWEVYWTDTSITIERVLRLNRCQKINRFVGMLEICRKNALAKNMSRMSNLFPAGDYGFIPRSFTLPAERADLEAILAGKKKRTYILKPDAGCQVLLHLNHYV